MQRGDGLPGFQLRTTWRRGPDGLPPRPRHRDHRHIWPHQYRLYRVLPLWRGAGAGLEVFHSTAAAATQAAFRSGMGQPDRREQQLSDSERQSRYTGHAGLVGPVSAWIGPVYGEDDAALWRRLHLYGPPHRWGDHRLQRE